MDSPTPPPDLYPALTTTATGVPVIGTLQMGSTSKHLELRTLPDGRTLGTVEAFPTGPGQHALRVLGDDLYPAVRHGNFLIVAPGRPCVPGELVLIETAEGHYLVQELVAEDDQFVTLLPATGGMRTTLARDQIATMDPITNNVSGSTFRQP